MDDEVQEEIDKLETLLRLRKLVDETDSYDTAETDEEIAKLETLIQLRRTVEAA